MRPSTIRSLRRVALVGAVLAPAFWVLKWILNLLQVVRDVPVPPKSFAGALSYEYYWEVIGACLLCVTLCSLLLLYVIVCPPPKDIDQHEA